MKIEKKIYNLMKEGVYCPNTLFKTLYPTYMGHYATLRKKIAEAKERGVN